MSEAQSPDLEGLLRKCHRPELLPLAKALGVNASGLGLTQLARAIAVTLRRRGGNDMLNLVFRRGEGPRYGDLLRALAERCGVRPRHDLVDTELALTEWYVETQWAVMTEEQRADIWRTLRLEPPAPPEGPAAVARIRGDLPASRLPYAATAAAATILRFVPFAGCFMMYWLARPKDELLLPAVLEVARLRQMVLHRITVGVVGSPSSGKDAAVRALFGIDRGNVNPVAGSTTEVEITRLPAATALYVVNTPGLGDVVERVTEEARQVIDHIDVYLYLVNAQGGVQIREKADYAMCKVTGRPVLAVVNKVDTLKPEDRERFLEDCRRKLGIGDGDLVAAAFDPLPQLAPTPLGVSEVRDWIQKRLAEAGKDAAELPW
jgi:GTP-binding protein EngB required for normal cell division